MSLLKSALGFIPGGNFVNAAASLAGAASSAASRAATQDKELAGVAPSTIAAAVPVGQRAAASYTDPLQQAKAFRAAISSISPGVHNGAADALTRQYYPGVSTDAVNPHKPGGIASVEATLLPAPLAGGGRTTGTVQVDNGKVSGSLGFDTNPQTGMYVLGLVLFVVVLFLLKKV